MFRWNKQKLIDLACHPDLTVSDIATRIGASKSAVEKQLRHIRPQIEAAGARLDIPEKMHCSILDMWWDKVPEHQIAAATGVGADTVRRLITISQIDEELSDDRMAA